MKSFASLLKLFANRVRPSQSGSESPYDRELDATGINCPLPIIRARKTLDRMQSGKLLHITTTDPGSVKDFSAFSQSTGHELLETSESDGHYHFVIRKA